MQFPIETPVSNKMTVASILALAAALEILNAVIKDIQSPVQSFPGLSGSKTIHPANELNLHTITREVH